jgi:KipI family sensor histidine kinase inhibitor
VTDARIVEAGDSALLLELEPVIDPRVNARAIAIGRFVRGQRIAGVRDVVPAYCSVAVHFDPLVADVAAVRAALDASVREPAAPETGRTLDVPVAYDDDSGPDLGEVARWSGTSRDAVVALHAGREYRVFMLGFLPGFPYLGVVDERIAAPRRASPRLRVPAGSVGIAGRQTGIYPQAAPGGWQIIGRTSLGLFDASREPPALLAPGDAVRFVPGPAVPRREPSSPPASGQPAIAVPGSVTVLRPGLLTTIQDEGRWGHQASGVPVAGPLDVFSHRLANALVGNGRRAAALEVTIVGPELRFEDRRRIALAGSGPAATLDGRPVPVNRPVECAPGSVLRFGSPAGGARTYVAVEGGIMSPPVLGSRATHVRSGMGGVAGRAVAAGDRLPLGSVRDDATPARGRTWLARRAETELGRDLGGQRHEHGARLRILVGPHHALVGEAAVTVLERTRFVLGPSSDRMGYRLSGATIPSVARDEMISGPTFAGAIQVPPSGEPILLMADRQTTGGYPQIATVITADQPRAGQLAPGDWVEFEICTRREAIAALVAQEGQLLALE